jgi:hypothetical protein
MKLTSQPFQGLAHLFYAPGFGLPDPGRAL